MSKHKSWHLGIRGKYGNGLKKRLVDRANMLGTSASRLAMNAIVEWAADPHLDALTLTPMPFDDAAEEWFLLLRVSADRSEEERDAMNILSDVASAYELTPSALARCILAEYVARA